MVNEVVRFEYRQYLAIKFLDEFSKRFIDLLVSLSDYLTNYDKLVMTVQQRKYIDSIYSNLLIVVSLLRSFDLDDKSQKIVEELYDFITNNSPDVLFSKEVTFQIMDKVSILMSSTFLSNITKKVYTAEHKLLNPQ